MRSPALTDHDIKCLGVLLGFEGGAVVAVQRVCPHPGFPTLGTLYRPGSPYAISEYAVDRHNAEHARVHAHALMPPELPA